MKRWFVAHTHAQSEAKAAFHLRNQGFSVYLPQYTKVRRHARRRELISAPLFPRYIFVGLDLDLDQWRAVHSTVGVHNLVCRGDQPVPVADEVIDEIRSREDASGKVVVNKIQGLEKGDIVQVLHGALADQYGIFQSATDTDRVQVLLNLLGRPIRVELPIEAIAATA